MKRREFITLLGGAAAWPVTARAQQSVMPMIGFLDPTSHDTYAERLRAFRQGLKDTGYVESENVMMLYRSAENQFDRLPELAADLVRRQVTVIAAAGGSPSALAAKAATPSIPIVFTVSEDPVRLGLVASLARPGGNVTGINIFSGELVSKRLDLLRELIPGTARIAVLINPSNVANTATTLRDVEAGARAMGLQIQIFKATTHQEIDAVFTRLLIDKLDALFVGNDAFLNSRRMQLALLATRHAVPAIYASRDYVDAGGLISYGTSFPDTYRQFGAYVGRVLKGAKPADLPVLQASKFELVINAVAARTLGLAVPPSLLARADEVIE
jgi:putative tryptophan/tyrosine transport system substrate-binding protein